MPSARAAALGRLGVATLVAALAAACLVAASAQAGGSSWSSYLAPATTCAGADDPAAAPAVQRRAIACLVNWARRRDGRSSLATPNALQRAAALKGRRVVSCNDFSHTPCGSDPTASLRASGYRYSTFGEDLWVGTWGAFSVRDVVGAWLASPMHRANVLRASFSDFGAALVRAPGLMGDGDAGVWVATFASPRRG